MNKSESITALAAALSKAQGEMPVIPFDATNPFLKNRFASLGSVIEHSRPILLKHGLSICQLPISENGLVGVESILMHSSGEWIGERILLPLSDEKGKSLAQVAGSITTYLKRYSWASLLGLYADEDTDGSMANGHSQEAKQPVSAPVKPQPKPAEIETNEQKWARFLKLFEPYAPYAAEVFLREGFILETEEFDAISVSRVASFKKAQVDALLADVKKVANAWDNAPGEEELPLEIASIIIPIPRKGMKRDEYLKRPDTIGSLYEAAPADEEAARRLFGLVEHYQPAPWVGKDGRQRPPSSVDVKFREALDRFAEWREQKEKA